MEKNIELKMELYKQDKTTTALSEETGINRSYLCMITNGRMIPTEDQKVKIANALQVQVKKLFR